jgi:hypothetical protein
MLVIGSELFLETATLVGSFNAVTVIVPSAGVKL